MVNQIPDSYRQLGELIRIDNIGVLTQFACQGNLLWLRNADCLINEATNTAWAKPNAISEALDRIRARRKPTP